MAVRSRRHIIIIIVWITCNKNIREILTLKMYCWWNVDLEIIATGQSSTKAAKFEPGRDAMQSNSIQFNSIAIYESIDTKRILMD